MDCILGAILREDMTRLDCLLGAIAREDMGIRDDGGGEK